LAGVTVHRRPRPPELRPDLRDPRRRDLKSARDIQGTIPRGKLLGNPPVPAVELLQLPGDVDPCASDLRRSRLTGLNEHLLPRRFARTHRAFDAHDLIAFLLPKWRADVAAIAPPADQLAGPNVQDR